MVWHRCLLQYLTDMKKWLLGVVSLLLMAACSGAESEYDTMHSAAFLYKNVAVKHALRSALDGSGVYCSITCRNNVYYFTNNYGATDTDNLLAINNGIAYRAVAGFIVGRAANIDMHGNRPLYAFDLACPNCDAEYITRALTLPKDGTTVVECSRCYRKYDLELGGKRVAGSKGIKLIQYHATFDGNNILQIYN